MRADLIHGWNKTRLTANKLDRKIKIQVEVNLVRQNFVEINGWLHKYKKTHYTGIRV